MCRPQGILPRPGRIPMVNAPRRPVTVPIPTERRIPHRAPPQAEPGVAGAGKAPRSLEDIPGHRLPRRVGPQLPLHDLGTTGPRSREHEQRGQQADPKRVEEVHFHEKLFQNTTSQATEHAKRSMPRGQANIPLPYTNRPEPHQRLRAAKTRPLPTPAYARRPSTGEPLLATVKGRFEGL